MNQNIKKHIRDALDGNQQAFRELLNFYWKDVFTFLMSRGLNEDDAEDLTVLTFTKAFDKIALYKEDYGFKNWLFSIAQNNYVDLMRKNKNLISAFANISSADKLNEMVNQIPDFDTPEKQMIQKQSHKELLIKITQLKPKYREIMELRYLEGMSVAKIAQHLEISLSNVKIRLMRARRLLFSEGDTK